MRIRTVEVSNDHCRRARLPFNDAEVSSARISERAKKVLTRYDDVVQDALTEGYGLYCYGAPGSGKSFALSALARSVMRYRLTVLYLTSEELRTAFLTRGEPLMFDVTEDKTLLQRALDVNILILDGLGNEFASTQSDFWEKSLRGLVEQRNNASRHVTWITSNQSPDALRSRYSDTTIATLTRDRYLVHFEDAGAGLKRTKRMEDMFHVD